MFKIRGIVSGSNGAFYNATTELETLVEAEILVRNAFIDRLNTLDVQLVYEDDLVYDVYSDGRSVGAVVIESL